MPVALESSSSQSAQNVHVPTRTVYAGPQGGDLRPRSGRFGCALWGGRVGGREIVAIGASQAGSRAQPEFGEVIVLEDRKVAWRARGRRAQDALGSSLVAVDRKGVGTPDVLAIGAVQGWGSFSEPACGPGRIELRRLTDGELIWEAAGSNLGDWCGAALCPLEDLNGDGFTEIAVGATQRGGNRGKASKPGACAVLSTKDGSVIWTASGRSDDRLFGESLARIADLDHDGFDDLLVGAPGQDEEKACGRIAVLSAASGIELTSLDWRSDGVALGSSLLSAGDLDGDGCIDVLGIALESNGINPVRARVVLVSGADLQVREIGKVSPLWPSVYYWKLPLALGHSQEGLARIAVGLPGRSGDQFHDSLGGVEVIDLSGSRVARFEPDELERKRVGGDGIEDLNTGVCVAAIDGARADQDTTWLVGATGFFCWGSVAIAEGTDWKNRQLIVENELFKRPRGFDTRTSVSPPAKAPRFGSLGREDPRKP